MSAKFPDIIRLQQMRGSKKSPDADAAPSAKSGSASSHPKPEVLQASHFLQSGWRVAVALLVPSLLGIWIDRTFETEPIFTIVGVVLGLIMVKVVVYRFVNEKYGGKS